MNDWILFFGDSLVVSLYGQTRGGGFVHTPLPPMPHWDFRISSVSPPGIPEWRKSGFSVFPFNFMQIYLFFCKKPRYMA